MVERLRFLLSARKDRVVCGEGMPVEVSLINDRRTPVELTLGLQNSIVFKVRRHAEPPVTLVRSRLVALRHVTGDRPKPLPPNSTQLLMPGATKVFAEDPAAGDPLPLQAGRYSLSASWRVEDQDLASNVIEIEVEGVAPEHFLSLFCPFTGSHAQAFDHAGDVLQRDTHCQLADASVFERQAAVAAIDSMAQAIHVDPRLAGRWLGWMAEGSFGAFAAMPSGVLARPVPLAVDLLDARVVETAFQRAAAGSGNAIFDAGEGVFIVVGMRGSGVLAQPLVAGRERIEPGPVVPLGLVMPVHLRAQAMHRERSIRLIWTETVAGLTRVLMRRFGRDLQVLGPMPQCLYERRSRLAAFEVTPLDEEREPAFAHALFHSDEQEPGAPYLSYLRIPLAPVPGQEAVEWRIPLPRVPVDSYAIAGSANGKHLVLAQAGADVWRISAAQPSEWTIHLSQVAGLRHLRLATAGARYWAALGVDRGRGIICAPDPGFSHEG